MTFYVKGMNLVLNTSIWKKSNYTITLQDLSVMFL